MWPHNCHKDAGQKLRRIQPAIIPLTIVLSSQQPKKQFLVSTYQKVDDNAIVKTRKKGFRETANFGKSLGIPLFPGIFRTFLLISWQKTYRLHMGRDNNVNVRSTWEQIICRCMGEQIRSMQWPLGRPCQPHLQGFIATTILIQWNGCTPFCTPLNTGDAPLHPVIGLDYSSFYEGLQSSLFAHEKRDINAPRSISLSSYYYNSLVKHRPNNLNSIIWYPLWFVYRVTHS